MAPKFVLLATLRRGVLDKPEPLKDSDEFAAQTQWENERRGSKSMWEKASRVRVTSSPCGNPLGEKEVS